MGKSLTRKSCVVTTQKPTNGSGVDLMLGYFSQSIIPEPNKFYYRKNKNKE